MPAIDPDDLPKKKITHEMGQDLSLLSVGELADRVGLLKDEIARLEAEMAEKTRFANGSGQVFQEISGFSRNKQPGCSFWALTEPSGRAKSRPDPLAAASQ